MMQITAVLFDMGGTLYGYEQREQMGRANVAFLERLGFAPDDQAVRDARRRAGQEIEAQYATKRSFLHRDLFRDRISRTAELLGVAPPTELLDRFDQEQRQAVIDHLHPRPDARATLEGLRVRGISTSVVSNADEDYLGEVLRRGGLDDVLDHWTSSEEADSCKPDRAIYEYSLAKIGRSPAECLFVGDSLPHDVAGAAAVGLRTVLIGDPGRAAPLSHGLDAAVVADHQIESLIEILSIVDDLNA